MRRRIEAGGLRPAVVQHFEAAGAIPAGPLIRLDVTPSQLVWLQSATLMMAHDIERAIGRERKAVGKRVLLGGLREVLDLMRLLQ